MKKLFLTLVLLFPLTAFASSLGSQETDAQKKLPVINTRYDKNWNIVTRSPKSNKENIDLIMDKTEVLKQSTAQSQNMWQDRVKKVSVHFFVFPQSTSYSFSNADSQSCQVDISYSDKLKPVLMKNIDDDIYFTNLHEISHCYLSKDVFFKEMDWKIKLKDSQKEEYNMYIEEETNKLLVKTQCEDKNCIPQSLSGALPLVVYHETFADTLGAIWWLHLKGNKILPEIEELRQHRLSAYKQNQKTAEHVSAEALGNIINQSHDKGIVWEKLTNQQMFDLAIILSQDAFSKYLKNREEME